MPKVVKTYKINVADYNAAMQRCREMSAEKGKEITLSGEIEELVKKLASQTKQNSPKAAV